ncbi:alpha/beta fold hydrolase [filamentous cyanobacterium LEGE 11480]|uniref:Alpha/beta fold hydrolase n=1 Tax=Romeriopsis navalis LEGE 11480 TaxID=2777977 RepID=A0A928VLL6_9CYAN|nr:alpha/beta fold hydrolase [Romeriopsis navalis]MBE9029892.1 alpha/beta fold hydrolase [Romeriopsis navalis LEGE 11480]
MVASTAQLTYQTWTWRGHRIAYQQQGNQGPAVLCIHGFGASAYHWRQNLPDLATDCRVYALDLIGFGASDKPTPGESIDYTFETWSQQIGDFCRDVVREPTYLVGNSIGCVAILQAAVDFPQQVRGTAIINCSLRLLHVRKTATQPWFKRLGAPLLQAVLDNKAIGHWFFRQIAQPKTVKKILYQAYGRSEAVTDELVDYLITPARDPGAADVFLAFTAYSHGPLAEDLLPQLQCPAIILWGDQDPWEPIALGREYTNYPQVEQFIPLEGLGHCPQDEAPEIVNPILREWILAKQG